MLISGTGITPFTFNTLPNFEVDTRLALKWIKTSNGNYYATDRTSTTDVYECKIDTYGKASYIDNIIQQLNNNRITDNVINLTDFSDTEYIFGADVVHSDIDATVIEISPKQQNTWKGFGLSLKLRNLSPSLYATSSFPSLKYLDIGYVGDNELSINKLDTYSGVFTYTDDLSNVGIFEGTFLMTDTEMRYIRTYLRTVRGSSFTISSINGVTYPFGKTRGTYPITVKCIEYKDLGQHRPGFWKIRLKLAEVV